MRFEVEVVCVITKVVMIPVNAATRELAVEKAKEIAEIAYLSSRSDSWDQRDVEFDTGIVTPVTR